LPWRDALTLQTAELDKLYVPPPSGKTQKNFNNRIAGFYGFLRPLMLRLFVFHKYLVDLTVNRGFVSFTCEEILAEMELIQYLQIIGVGMKCDYVQDYLTTHQKPILLKDIEVNQCVAIRERSAKRDHQQLRKLVHFLIRLKLVDVDPRCVYDGSTGPVSIVRYVVKQDVNLEDFNERLPETHYEMKELQKKGKLSRSKKAPVKTFSFMETFDVKPFWDQLKKQCLTWIKREESRKGVKRRGVAKRQEEKEERAQMELDNEAFAKALAEEDAKALEDDDAAGGGSTAAEEGAAPSSMKKAAMKTAAAAKEKKVYPLRDLDFAFQRTHWKGGIYLSVNHRRRLEDFAQELHRQHPDGLPLLSQSTCLHLSGANNS